MKVRDWHHAVEETEWQRGSEAQRDNSGCISPALIHSMAPNRRGRCSAAPYTESRSNPHVRALAQPGPSPHGTAPDCREHARESAGCRLPTTDIHQPGYLARRPNLAEGPGLQSGLAQVLGIRPEAQTRLEVRTDCNLNPDYAIADLAAFGPMRSSMRGVWFTYFCGMSVAN